MSIENILLNRGYNEKTAIIVAKDLQTIDSSLVKILNSWIETERCTDFVIEGFSLLSIMKKFDMSYPAALLTIDWLIKEPQIAKNALEKGIK